MNSQGNLKFFLNYCIRLTEFLWSSRFLGVARGSVVVDNVRCFSGFCFWILIPPTESTFYPSTTQHMPFHILTHSFLHWLRPDLSCHSQFENMVWIGSPSRYNPVGCWGGGEGAANLVLLYWTLGLSLHRLAKMDPEWLITILQFRTQLNTGKMSPKVVLVAAGPR